MANVAYPPFFPAQILDGDGQPVANGSIRAAFAGSDVPAPLFTPDGTALGSSVTLNSSGEAVFCLRAGTAYKLTCLDAQGATVWTRDNVRVTTSDSGMANPMEAQADMIVGAVDGQPERLAAPANASFLRSYKNSDNVPVVKWSQLKAGANVTITDAGTQVTVAADTQPGDHKAQVSATDSTPNYLQNKIVTGDLVQVEKQQTPDGEGGYIESLRLNLDARGVTAGYVPTANGSNGSAWAAPAPQPGDHKTAVDGADASPDYLAAKLAAGSGISLTNTGSAVEIAATAQTGDHQLLVSATDAAAGYLGAKLTAGANVTLTPQTDGDGVQTLEISATGGGGGGVSPSFCEPFGNLLDGHFLLDVGASGTLGWFGRTPLRNVKIKSILVGTFGVDLLDTAEIGIYAMRSNRALTLLAKQSAHSITPDGSVLFELQTPVSVGNEIIFIGGLFSQTNTWSSNRVVFLNTNANSPLLFAMNDTSTIYTDMTKYPVMAYPFNALPGATTKDIVSRRGFYWPDFSLSTLPASTTSSDWHTTGSVLFLPYVAVEIS